MPNLDRILVSCSLIKYWGKSNEALILPLNSSISVTLDRHVLSAKTSLLLLKNNNNTKTKIKIWLNNNLQEFDDEASPKSDQNEIINKTRFLSMLNKMRSNCSLNDAHKYEIGLASSASGFACLAHCLSTAFEYNGNTSELARLGSRSACRSCFGGFVKWSSSDNPSLSIANALFPVDH